MTHQKSKNGIYHFNMDIAKDYGIDVAVFLETIYFWVKTNAANRRNYHDGYFWTYNTLDAFVELFPCWSRRQVEWVIKKSIEAGLLLKGNYNVTTYDRTCWYTLTEKALNLYDYIPPTISQNCEMDYTKLRNGNHKIVTPIPDIKPDIEPDTKNYCPSGDGRDVDKSNELMVEDKPDKQHGFEDFWKAYPRKEGKKAALKSWIKNKLYEKADIIVADVVKRTDKVWRTKERHYIPHAATYLNGERWNDEVIEVTEQKGINYGKSESAGERCARLLKQNLDRALEQDYGIMPGDKVSW